MPAPDPACPRCRTLAALLLDIVGAFPMGDLCRRADGCEPGVRTEEHPEACLTKRTMAALLPQAEEEQPLGEWP